MSGLELRIPPPAVALLTGLLQWLASIVARPADFTIPAKSHLAIAIALMGVGISALGLVSFRRARTTVNPMDPSATSSVVVSGIYRFTRNPMYLGLLLVVTGWAVYLSNAIAFACLLLFVLYMNRFQIRPEERALALKFGSAYSTYAHGVRRWL